MNLFNKGEFILSSGVKTDFKIDCDALTDEDIETLAFIISQKIKFHAVVPVPTGGDRLAKALQPAQVQQNGEDLYPLLICDDVLTTGASMEKMKSTFSENTLIRGVVIFNRSDKNIGWIESLFTASWRTMDLFELQRKMDKVFDDPDAAEKFKQFLT